MKNLYCLFLDRDNMREGLKTILQAIDYKKWHFHSHFPGKEPATMAEELSMLPFRDGALKIAEKDRVKVIIPDQHEQYC